MRLLHTTNLTFGDFFGKKLPAYCILSHRWGDHEVGFQDVQSGTVNKTTAGYKKLAGACQLARKLGWTWIWIDSACIDKTSSQEVAQAINSMMKWYSEADFCIAYLADVPRVHAVSSQEYSAFFNLQDFRRSVWWTRGWTLQELIAPRNVYFYNGAFDFIGSKSRLSREISDITGIEAVYLDGRRSYTEASIATRMSWSARRTCTREEDVAYCLLGLMQVNLPLLYGEGKMAFMRLQLQIVSQSDDETIFAWLAPKWVSSDQPFGMLAESPSYFQRSQNLHCTTRDAMWRLPYSFSNKGLEFSQYTGKFTGEINPSYTISGDEYTSDKRLPGGTYIRPDDQTRIALRCVQRTVDDHGKMYKRRVAIELRRVGNAWYRVHCNRFIFTSQRIANSGLIQTYYVAQPNMASQASNSRSLSIQASARARREWEDMTRHKDSELPSAVKDLIGGAAIVLGGMALSGWQRRKYG